VVEGEAIGRANEKKDIAKGMLADGLSVESVAKYTHLSVDDVKALLDELKKN